MKEENIEEENEDVPIEAVLGTVLQMVQYMQQMTNLEAAKILHTTKHCGDYIDNCPLCEQEARDEEE